MQTLRRLTYFIIIAVAALSASGLQPFAPTYWLIWSAFSLSLITFGNTFAQRFFCILLTGIGMAAAVSLAGLAAMFPPLFYAYICAATLFLVYAMNKWPAYGLPLFLLNMFVLLGIYPDADSSAQAIPASFILLGMLIALLPQFIFWPHYISNQIKQTILVTIKELQGLTNDVFYCLLQPDYKDKLYLYEKRIHIQKTKLLTARQRLHNQIEENKNLSGAKKDALHAVLAQLDLLYESFVSCAQVRWRTTDHTIFAVCQQDLAGILQEINRAYDEFILALTTHNKLHADLSPLNVRINQLEQTYQSVLQVTAREPVVMLLFVTNLQTFAAQLIAFNGRLSELRAIFK